MMAWARNEFKWEKIAIQWANEFYEQDSEIKKLEQIRKDIKGAK